MNAGWSSLVARWAHNPKVGGSNPPPATTQRYIYSSRQIGAAAPLGLQLPSYFAAQHGETVIRAAWRPAGDTAVNLQLKITTRILVSQWAEITSRFFDSGVFSAPLLR